MKTSATLLTFVFVAVVASADPFVISKQQARRVADPTTTDQQGQGVDPRSRMPGPAPAAQPAPAQMDPALAATMHNISDLRLNLVTLISATNSELAEPQKMSLLNNLSAAAQGAKPTASDVKRLADHLITALSGKKIPVPTQTKLARDIHAIFNGAHLTAAQQQLMFDDVQKTLTAAGASLDDTLSVVADLKSISAATK